MPASDDDSGDEGTSPVFRYGDPQAFILLNTKVRITAEDYEIVCKEAFMLKFFLADNLKKQARLALGRLSAKLAVLDPDVLCLLKDACHAEEEGEAALDQTVVTFK